MFSQPLLEGSVIELADGRLATVRFCGTTHFADGEWIGLKLDGPTGNNDGSVQSERYFDCAPGYGMFVRPTVVGKVVGVVQAAPEGKQTTKQDLNTAGSRAQPKLGPPAGLRKQSGLPPTGPRRQSTNAVSTPTPGPRGAGARTSIRSPTKSPTKQLGAATSHGTLGPDLK
ncbi:Dynein associated protein [Penicillium sp. DV-2018c]|nr:Dynein associated protein [Penicillium sp. DV-2018c]